MKAKFTQNQYLVDYNVQINVRVTVCQWENLILWPSLNPQHIKFVIDMKPLSTYTY